MGGRGGAGGGIGAGEFGRGRGMSLARFCHNRILTEQTLRLSLIWAILSGAHLSATLLKSMGLSCRTLKRKTP